MRRETPVQSTSFAVTDFVDRRGIVFNSGSKYGELSKCPRNWDGKKLEPSREGAPGGLDRASGFPFPL